MYYVIYYINMYKPQYFQPMYVFIIISNEYNSSKTSCV